MSTANLVQYGVFLVIVILLVRPVGGYLARVFGGERTWLDPLMRPLERTIYRLAGSTRRRRWTGSGMPAASSRSASGGRCCCTRCCACSPSCTPSIRYRPGPLAPDLAMNTAISFATTTTWQAYGGETTMSYFSQVVGLTAQNFLAGAAGLAVGIAFIRGLARQRTRLLGNFWVDVTRATLWVLLPLAVVGTLVLVWQGVPLNFAPYAKAAMMQPVEYEEPVSDAEGKPVLDEKGQPRTKKAKLTEQVIAMGPSPSWNPSRTSARTAAASSTSTARTPSRTQPRSRTCWRCWRSPCCPPPSPTPSAGWSAGPVKAGYCSR